VITIAVFFTAHWLASILFQTVFLHRYCAHRMFTMSPLWERLFHLGAFVALGSSYLAPRAYAILHREHHAFADAEGDPHSPHTFRTIFGMMWRTRQRYGAIVERRAVVEPRFEGGCPEWPALERFGEAFPTRIAWGVLYTLVYVAFAPHWAYFVLLPAHWLMGPIHGAIVNWCGHKYGYRNFATPDRSRNALPFDLLTMGELFQNNHHRYPMAPNFAARWFEVDPGYLAVRILFWLGIVHMRAHVQKARWHDGRSNAASEPG
jgi:stearoyl-CoA desaturase (Delta-9 desaturase)